MIDKKLQFVLSSGPDMIKQVTFCFMNCCELFFFYFCKNVG